MNSSFLLCCLTLCAASLSAQNQQVPSLHEQTRQQNQPQEELEAKKPHTTLRHVPQALTEGVQLCDSMVQYNEWNEPIWKTEYLYDENGCLIQQTIYQKADGYWSNYKKTDFVNDEKGNHIEEFISNYNLLFQAWLTNGKITRNYDENGKMIEYAVYDKNGNDWYITYKEEYAYDSFGNQICFADYYLKDNQLVGNHKVEQSYDALGRYCGLASYFWSNGDWIGSFKQEKEFDENGQMTKIANCDWTESGWVITSLSEWTYEDNGLVTNSMTYIREKGELILSSQYKIVYNYDSNGRAIEGFKYDWMYNDWHLMHRTLYTYDENGHLIIEEGANPDEDGWNNKSKIEYSYNDNDSLVCRISYIWKLGIWYPESKEQHTYEDQNRREIHTYSTYLQDKWIPETRNEVVYDEAGNLIFHAQSDWIDDEWINKNVSEYAFDAFGNYLLICHYTGEIVVDGPMTLNVNFAGDTFVDNFDQNGLLFSGNAYSINTIYVDVYNESSENGSEQHRYLWKNNNQLGTITWSSGYLFALEDSEAAANANIILSAEDWETIKNEDFKIEINSNDPQNMVIRLKSGWEKWTEQDIRLGDGLLDADFSNKLIGYEREENTYDDNGNYISHIKFYWENGQWIVNTKDIYYYSAQENGIGTILSPLHRGVHKELYNGQIRIFIDDKCYDALGNQIE